MQRVLMQREYSMIIVFMIDGFVYNWEWQLTVICETEYNRWTIWTQYPKTLMWNWIPHHHWLLYSFDLLIDLFSKFHERSTIRYIRSIETIRHLPDMYWVRWKKKRERRMRENVMYKYMEWIKKECIKGNF